MFNIIKKIKSFFLGKSSELTKFILSNSGKIILIDGAWGSGKTWKWKHIIEKEIKSLKCHSKQVVYHSLFGLYNLDDLKSVIFNNYIQKIRHSFFYKLIKLIACSFITYKTFLFFTNLKISNTIILSVILIIAFIITYKIYEYLFVAALNQYAGINHQSIQITHLYKPQDTIFCFDDFERILNKEKCGGFLGYFKLLAYQYGYTVVVLANMKDYKISDLGGIYKEKVFDKCIRHTFENGLKEILKTSDNIYLNEMIENVYKKVQKAQQNIKDSNTDKQDSKDSDTSIEDNQIIYLELLSENLRIAEKIIDNYNDLSEQIPNLDDHKKIEDIIQFVIYITIFEHLNILDINDDAPTIGLEYLWDDEKKKNKEVPKFLKDIIIINKFSENFPEIRNLLIKKELNKDKLLRELYPDQYGQENLTSFERMALTIKANTNHATSSKVLRINLQQMDTLIRNSNKNLFSSFDNMRKSLGVYFFLLFSENITDMKRTIKSKLEISIKFLIETNPIDYQFLLDKDTYFGYYFTNQYKKIELEFENIINKLLFEKIIQDMKKTKDICSYILSYKKNEFHNIYEGCFIYLLAIDKTIFKNFSELKNKENYSNYKDIIYMLSEGSFFDILHLIQNTYNIKKDIFINLANNLLKDIEKFKNIGYREKINAPQLEQKINTFKKHIELLPT